MASEEQDLACSGEAPNGRRRPRRADRIEVDQHLVHHHGHRLVVQLVVGDVPESKGQVELLLPGGETKQINTVTEHPMPGDLLDASGNILNKSADARKLALDEPSPGLVDQTGAPLRPRTLLRVQGAG